MGDPIETRTLGDILNPNVKVTPVLNRKQQRYENNLARKKAKLLNPEITKQQAVERMKYLQSCLHELVNNPESDFSQSIIKAVKI